MGEVRVDGLGAHLSDTDWQMHKGAPTLSEHTRDVLTRLLGYTDAEVDTLYEEDVL